MLSVQAVAKLKTRQSYIADYTRSGASTWRTLLKWKEMLDCKLDALIRSFAFEKKRFSCQHKSAVSRDL